MVNPNHFDLGNRGGHMLVLLFFLCFLNVFRLLYFRIYTLILCCFYKEKQI